ncbi:MAG: hypothetical protein COB50_04210 [Thiotrichales bacterium]|nr:MAG: hypothetical protein COB50_04210 [Thiotrichales bacterium]
MNTIEYLDTVKSRYKWVSDYKLSKEIGLSQSRMSNYRCGRSEMDEDMCLKVAKLLKISEAGVLIDIVAERTKSEKASKILNRTAKKLIGNICLVIVTIAISCTSLYPIDAMAKIYNSSGVQCILCKIKETLIYDYKIHRTSFFNSFFTNRTFTTT